MAVADPRAFIAAAARQPFAWGRHDCFLLAADWVQACTGRDPAEGWRGTYHTALGASRLMRASGGVLMLARETMAGFDETSAPRDGDVAIVEGGFERRKGRAWISHAAGVHLGGRWVVRTRSGLVGNVAPLVVPVIAWRIV